MENVIQALKIRQITADDKDKLYQYFRQLGDEGGTFFNRNGRTEKITYEFINGEKPNHIFWAAVNSTPAGEEIVGLMFLWDTNTKIPWLGIGITENWKGRRLGRRLMNVAKEWVESVGGGGIRLTTAPENIRGQHLYAYMGYERIGTYIDGEFLYILPLPNNEQV